MVYFPPYPSGIGGYLQQPCRPQQVKEFRNEEDSDSLLGGFRADEYGDIYEPTQPPVTESQLSTHRVFDSQETCIPGSLQ